MTSDIEKEFFRVFGIEPICHNPILRLSKNKKCEGICKNCKQYKYLQITSDRLLEMICILNETACEALCAENKEDLKNEILETCIKVYNTPILTSDGDEYENTAIYDKIRQLFKDGE